MVKTPNNGLHLYFRQPPGEPLGNGRGSLPAGCDVRGVGGFVIGPGAVLPDGRGWVRVTERPPVTQAAQLAWIESILRPPAAEPPHDDPAGETSDQRGRAYAEQALHEIEPELAITKEGERNERLYKAAFRLGTMAARGWLAEAEIRNALRRACQANGLIKDDGAPAFQRTLESGLADGLKIPHEDLKDREQYARHEEAPATTRTTPRNERGIAAAAEAAAQHRELGGAGTSILDDRRGELPEFPCETMPAYGSPGSPCSTRRRRHHRPCSGVCDHDGRQPGSRTAMRVPASRSWSEPLTLWSALIGFSGTGKIPASTLSWSMCLCRPSGTMSLVTMQLAPYRSASAAESSVPNCPLAPVRSGGCVQPNSMGASTWSSRRASEIHAMGPGRRGTGAT